MKNYHKILGLEPGASAEEIKKAYRSLANRYHPDKHVGSSDAAKMEEKFKEVKQAYEALTSNKHTDFQESMPHEPGMFTDMDQIIEAMRRAHQNRANTIPMVTLRVDLPTAFRGTVLPINVYGKSIGYRLRPGMPSGVVFQDEVPIDDKSKPVQIRLLIVHPNFTFRQEGSFDGQNFSGDLETQVEVDAIEIMLGAWKKVTNFTGEELNIRIPRGFEFQRQKLRLAGQGYLNWKNDGPVGRADIFVRVVPKITPIEIIDPNLVEQLYTETRPKSETPK